MTLIGQRLAENATVASLSVTLFQRAPAPSGERFFFIAAAVAAAAAESREKEETAGEKKPERDRGTNGLERGNN